MDAKIEPDADGDGIELNIKLTRVFMERLEAASLDEQAFADKVIDMLLERVSRDILINGWSNLTTQRFMNKVQKRVAQRLRKEMEGEHVERVVQTILERAAKLAVTDNAGD